MPHPCSTEPIIPNGKNYSPTSPNDFAKKWRNTTISFVCRHSSQVRETSAQTAWPSNIIFFIEYSENPIICSINDTNKEDIFIERLHRNWSHIDEWNKNNLKYYCECVNWAICFIRLSFSTITSCNSHFDLRASFTAISRSCTAIPRSCTAISRSCTAISRSCTPRSNETVRIRDCIQTVYRIQYYGPYSH